MKKWKTLLILAFLAIGLVISLVYRTMQDRRSNEQVKRIYRTGYVNHVRSLPMPFHIAEIRFSRNRLFLYNTSDMQIVESDTLGGIIRRYGGKGGNSREFQLITGWDVDDHTVYVMDERKLSIAEIDSTNAVTSHYSLKMFFNRAHRLGAKKYLVKYTDQRSIRHQVFQLINLSTGSETILEYPLPKVQNEMALDGFFITTDEGENFYLCHWTGWFFCIDSNATFLYKRETVDRSPQPEIYEGSGHMSIDPDAKLVNISAYTDKKNLYILSRAYIFTDDSTQGIVDSYERKTGNYLYSFVLPAYDGKRPRAIAGSHSGLYVVQGNAVVYYRFSNLPQ